MSEMPKVGGQIPNNWVLCFLECPEVTDVCSHCCPNDGHVFMDLSVLAKVKLKSVKKKCSVG